MANNGNSVEDFYVRLGLNLSELESGFVEANRTITQNIGRLNRQANLIRLRSEVEISGLDEASDAERILQIRTNALNQQMAIQRDRIRLMSAELQNLTNTYGANATVTQGAAIRLERERLALANLERELRNSNDAQGETNNLFGELNELLPSMPTKLQAVGLAFGAITTGAGAAYTAVNELLENFRELQTQAYELNMSLPDTREFLMKLELGGGDIGDLEGYIRGITDAYVKGEYDDPEFIALRKYGAEITDATGRLKEFKDLTEEVYQAWKKADEAGEGIEFLQLTGGESGIRDAIQLFKRYEEAKADAAKIFKADFDEKQLHEFERAMNLVEEQSKELKNALGDIFVPMAQVAAENFFKVVHDGTEYLVENKDAIQKWGFIAIEVFEELAAKIPNLFPSGQLQTVIESLDKILPDLPNNYAEQLNPESPARKLLDNIVGSDLFKKNPVSQIIERAEQAQKKFNDKLEESGTLAEKLAESISKGAELVEKIATGDPLSQYGWQRLESFKDELEDLRIELDFGDNDYQKSLAQLDLWRERELSDKLSVSLKERQAIEELYAAKLAQIDQERADKIAEIQKSVDAEFKTSLQNRLDKINEEKDAWISAGMEEAEATELAQKRIAKAYEDADEKVQEHLKNAADIEYSLTHTAFEKQLRDIERWEEAQKKKAETAEEISSIVAESAAKEAEAFEREVDRIKGKIQTLEDKIFEQEHSRFENEMRKLDQERLNYYKEGIYPAELIERYYQNARNDLTRKAKESQAKGGDYTKTPEGAMQRGGNGIMVIGGDQILDDGLTRGQQQVINLLADENRIREQLLQNLDADAQAAVERIQAAKTLTDAEKMLAQSAQQAASGIQIIEGDQIVSNQPQLPQQSTNGYQIIGGDQVVSMPTSTLPNIEADVKSVLQELQMREPQAETITFETIVTPLNNITGLVQNILSALGNQQQPQVNVSPNIHNDLGGAYVFDDAMKSSLVNDITSKIVSEITSAVQQATSRSSYSYSS